ncbi:UvrABC system protein C OS=Streptomyces alboniger OX=132473 GN=uvrC PE=3 SV=1 [Streptomyces alboniger]
MVTTAASVEWTVVSTEVEALQLEYSWIKEYDPRFNVKYRDDKSYPYLAVTMNEEFPRVQVMRGQKKKGVRHSATGTPGRSATRSTSCCASSRCAPAPRASSRTPPAPAAPACSATSASARRPASGRITPDDHWDLADEFCDFMAGRTGTYLRRLERQMAEAAEDHGVREGGAACGTTSGP